MAGAHSIDLLAILRREKSARLSGGIYHRLQVEMTYNSNHIEGSRLTEEQTRQIFETRSLLPDDQPVRVDDIAEATGHFRAMDIAIETAEQPLTEDLMKRLHEVLLAGTSRAELDWFAVGGYKQIANEVGFQKTVSPQDVPTHMRRLIAEYEDGSAKSLEDLLAFHVHFERIHPFQDGNGRVGRLILFKECLRYGITPMIITEDLKLFYYRGLREWDTNPGFLTSAGGAAQEHVTELLQYFFPESRF